jgi:hypothetical protein
MEIANFFINARSQKPPAAINMNLPWPAPSERAYIQPTESEVASEIIQAKCVFSRLRVGWWTSAWNSRVVEGFIECVSFQYHLNVSH